MKTKSPVKAYLLKITLEGIQPKIWRRIPVTLDTSLSDLQKIIQAAMGWHNSHLHEFTINDRTFIEPDFDGIKNETHEDENDFTLKQLDFPPGLEFSYIYDFGDGGIHHLIVEDSISQGQYADLPLCIDGKRACPPEDVGGSGGYSQILKSINDPGNEEHESILRWIGGSFDLEEFTLKEINERLSVIKYSHSRWVKYTPTERHLLNKINAICQKWNSKQFQTHAKTARALPLRQDAVTLLSYIRDNKVVGTQATGNFPLKTVDEIGSHFVHSVGIEWNANDTTFQARSEEDVWPVFFIHLLVDALGLVQGCPSRRWKIAPAGEEFLILSPLEQTWAFFVAWGRRLNWVDIYPIILFGDYLPLGFESAVMKKFRQASYTQSVNFDQFAVQIGDHFFYWKWMEDEEWMRDLFAQFTKFAIINIPDALGLVIPVRKPDPKWPQISKISKFSVKDLGRFFSNQVEDFYLSFLFCYQDLN